MAKLGFIKYFSLVAALTASVLGFTPRMVVAVDVPPWEPGEPIQVLSSGPIHEAFAEPVPFNPHPGIVAPKAPPAPIQEIPPDQRPEGAVQWISGYWTWDDERDAYIWVSGTWRIPPPGRHWVPGYWAAVGFGYQWISGYWASVTAKATDYLPAPPESLEAGPNTSAPSSEHTWIPGCWVWEYGRYAWRSGYWALAHPDWIWVPSHYVWTPSGYVFVGGYWDYPIIRRGVLFAPVAFTPPMGVGMTFSLSPGFVINLSLFFDALFVGARNCHYYYGNYYAPRYAKRGIYPWFSLHAGRTAYDPIYAYQRWKHRNDHTWEKRLHAVFRERAEQKALRPKQSLDLRTRPAKAVRASWSRSTQDAVPPDPARKNTPGTSRIKPVKEKQPGEFSRQEKADRTDGTDRRQPKTEPHKMQGQRVEKKPVPGRAKIAGSPITNRPNEKVIRNKASPAGNNPPKPNPDGTSLKKDQPRTFPKQEKAVPKFDRDRPHQAAQPQQMQKQRAVKKSVPAREKVAGARITDRPNEKAIRNKASTATDKAPKTNPNVEPQKKKNDTSHSFARSQNPEQKSQKSNQEPQRGRKMGNRTGKKEKRK